MHLGTLSLQLSINNRMTLFLLAIIVHTVLIPIDILFQMIRVDNASYSSNSVVVGMQEGYYVDTEVGGYPSPRRPSFHKIMDFLPPQSLIEVRKTEVSVCVPGVVGLVNALLHLYSVSMIKYLLYYGLILTFAVLHSRCWIPIQ